MQSVRDPIRRRQPVERPLDIVLLELLVSVSQALLAGIMLSLAAQLGGDARAYGLPVPGLLAVLAIAVGVGWLRWLVGGTGWLMASISLAIAILAGALWLLALQDAGLPRIEPIVGIVAAACAIYGIVAGVFLDGPHREHWKGGISRPRRGMPQDRMTPARFSPPVQRVVDTRLSNLHMPLVALPSASAISLPGVKRPTRSTSAAPVPGDGLAVAAAVAPHPPMTAVEAPLEASGVPAVTSAAVAEAPAALPGTPAVEPASATQVPPAAHPDPPVAPASATDLAASEPMGLPSPTPTAAAAVTPPTPDAESVSEATQADPEAPTQPVAQPAAAWPRPIEPRGHTGEHKVDPGA